MPLLPKETDIHPEELFSLPPEMAWRVAHVRSRQEKMLARHLLQRDVSFYLPQITKTVRGSGRRRTSHLPLFPGYLFFRGDRNARAVVVRSDLAVSILEVTDQELLGRELRQIRDLQLAGASLIPTIELAPGDAVRITEGAFAGYVGTVVRSGRAERLVVSISLLRKQVAVEFDPAVLKRPRIR